jgi:hypothetical protein
MTPLVPAAMSLAEILAVVSTSVALISLVAAAIFFVWHLREIKRTQESTERNREDTRRIGRQTLAALQLNEVIVEDDHLAEVVRELASQYVRLSKYEDPLATLLANGELDRIYRFMNMGAEGYITVGSDAFAHADRLASALLRTTSRDDEFWATSLVDPEFWHHATAYLSQQAAKREEGVAIHRVFVFDTRAAFLDPRAQEQMCLQHEKKIDVRYVVEPPYDMRDLVVVRKPVTGEASTEDPSAVSGVSHVATYAMECRVGVDKRVDHIDLWAAYGLHSGRVDETWWNLDGIYQQSIEFVLPATLVPAQQFSGPERRYGERRHQERRTSERRIGDRRSEGKLAPDVSIS